MKGGCKAGSSSQGFGFWFSSSSRDQGDEGRQDRGREDEGRGQDFRSLYPSPVHMLGKEKVFTRDSDPEESLRGKGGAEDGRRETREKEKE